MFTGPQQLGCLVLDGRFGPCVDGIAIPQVGVCALLLKMPTQ